MPARRCLILSLLALAVPSTPAGAAGELDPTFGTGGRVTGEIGLADNVPTDALVQPDGKVVIVGRGTGNFDVTRLDADGSVDRAFGEDGTASHTFDDVGQLIAGGQNAAQAVALQPDGKIVVAGSVESKALAGDDAYFSFGGIIRLNADGSLDTSFSDDGKVFRGGVISESNSIVDVAITEDDQILVARRNEIARYTSAGGVDTTFSGDGSVDTEIGVARFVVLPGGAIVVAGSDQDNDGDFAASRYTVDGVLDTEFADGGTQRIALDQGGSVNGVALGAGGSIVLAGSRSSFSEGDYAIARLEADGDRDLTFSEDGLHVFEGLDGAFFQDVAVDAENRPVAVGVEGFGNFRDMTMTTVRFEPDGDPDPAFAEDGIVSQSFGSDPGDDRGTAVVLAGDKVLSLATTDATPAGAVASDYGLARYDATGSLDPSFSGDGLETVDAGDVFDAARAAAVQPDGKIVVVGDTFLGSRQDGTSRFGVARYAADGTPDPSFGTDGRLTTDFDSDDESAQDVVVQPDGKIVVVGWVGELSFRRIAIARYDADGTLDETFSNDGKVTTELEHPPLAEAHAVALDGDKLVVAGRARDGDGNIDFLVARYNPDGALDEDFSGDGVELTDVGPRGDGATDLALLPGGALVAAGSTSSNTAAAVARYTSAGVLDTSFGDGGKKVIELAEGDDPDDGDGFEAVTLSGSSIVAVGPAGADFGVVRLTEAGDLDPSFSGDGIQTADFGSFDTATGVGQQADGRILVGGYARVGNGDDFALARFTPDGTLDASFGGDGTVTTDFAGRADGAFGMTMGRGDTVLLVGTAAEPDTNEFDFAVARYVTAGGPPAGGDPPGGDPPGGGGPPAGPPAVLPPPTPPAGTGPDTVAPVLSKARLEPGKFRTRKRGRKRAGTRLTFALSEAATVTVVLSRCKDKRCKKTSRAGSIVLRGTPGTNTARFAGKVRRKALKRGRYRARAVARDAAGNESRRVTLRFRVVR